MCDNNSQCFTSYDQFVKTNVIDNVDHPIETESFNVAISYNIPSSPSSSSSPLCLHTGKQEDLVTIKQISLAPNKKTHGRKREAGYVARPRNAFIVFRSEYIKLHRDQGEGQQNELSKQAGKAWNKMTLEQKQVFRDTATLEQRQHKIEHPNYQYTPGPRRTSSQAKSTKSAARKARAASAAVSSRAGRASCAVEENWPTSSSPASSGSYSPEYIPSRAARIPRAAAQVAVQRLEQIVSVPSPQYSSPSSESTFYPASQDMEPQQLDLPLCDEFIPTDEIPLLDLNQTQPMKEAEAGEPYFVQQCPPTLEYTGHHFGLNPTCWPQLYQATFPTHPNSSIPVMYQTLYNFNARPSPDLAYPLPAGAHPSELLPLAPENGQWQPHVRQSYSDDGQVDYAAFLQSSPEVAFASLPAEAMTL